MLRRLLPLALGEDFLQALSLKSYSRTSGLGHLLREFEPVHSHGYKDTLPATVLKIFSCIRILSQSTRKDRGTRRVQPSWGFDDGEAPRVAEGNVCGLRQGSGSWIDRQVEE